MGKKADPVFTLSPDRRINNIIARLEGILKNEANIVHCQMSPPPIFYHQKKVTAPGP